MHSTEYLAMQWPYKLSISHFLVHCPITKIMRKANANNSKVFGTVIVIYKCTMQSSNYYLVINVKIVI